jgi:hypothetical protein
MLRMPDTHLSRIEWAFAVVGATLVMILVWVATQKYGLGVSSDSAFYLSSADSFSKTRSLFDFEGEPLLLWPAYIELSSIV